MFFIANAYAQAAPAATGGAEGSMMSIGFMVLIFVVFYFLLIRPQVKRQKEHKALIEALKKGRRGADRRRYRRQDHRDQRSVPDPASGGRQWAASAPQHAESGGADAAAEKTRSGQPSVTRTGSSRPDPGRRLAVTR
jgi:hypothetical protein